jgi:hypothetical protein
MHGNEQSSYWPPQKKKKSDRGWIGRPAVIMSVCERPRAAVNKRTTLVHDTDSVSIAGSAFSSECETYETIINNRRVRLTRNARQGGTVAPMWHR